MPLPALDFGLVAVLLGAEHRVRAKTVGVQFQEDGRALLSHLGHRSARGVVHRQHVHAVEMAAVQAMAGGQRGQVDARVRQLRGEGDLARRHRRSQPAAGMAQQLAPQSIPRIEARLERDESLDGFAQHRVGHADHRGLGHRRVGHQGGLDLERADQVAGRLDHVVGASDKPEIAFGFAPHQVTGQVGLALGRLGEAFAVARLLAQVAAEHRRPAAAQRQFTTGLGRADHGHPVFRLAADHESLHPRQRLAHGPRA